ncbi:MAG: hypothetical protein JSW09_01110 [Pseudomonadota bacterium]|nr:MAG: hypothetical protein JSW09_01110 [Pseudomonadota bacterium]
MKLNVGQLASAVQQNCHISDARHAGDFSLCVFLLKMREYYRWEQDIPLTHTLAREEVGAWMQEREQLWDGLDASDYQPLPLAAGPVDPFEVEPINRQLVPEGYVYSAGLGRFCKPHFFLGRLHRHERRAGFSIYTSSCEYARDIEAPPAMLLGRDIFVRRESVRRFLWEKIEESRFNKNNVPMQHVLRAYPFDVDIDAALEGMTQNETETMTLHELGEGMAGQVLGQQWEKMLLALARSKAEIMARAVRDLIADCSITLPELLKREALSSLHFYFANFTGMRKHLYPELGQAYRRWLESNDLRALHHAAASGKDRWQEAAGRMLAFYERDGAQVSDAIVQLLEPRPSQ